MGREKWGAGRSGEGGGLDDSYPQTKASFV